MNRPLITVIIPLYNKEKAIATTLRSVLGQTYADLDIVVVDDGSTDGSAAIVKKVAEGDPRVRYFLKENGGVSSARNYGLEQALGDWVCFLDADDEMLPRNLEHLLQIATDYHVGLAAASVLVHTGSGALKTVSLRRQTKSPRLYKNFIKALLKRETLFATGACLYKKELLGVKPYDERLARYEDAGFEIDILAKSPVVFSSEANYVHHAEHAGLSLNSNKKKERDFIFNMDFRGKTFWQKVKMGQFVQEGCYTYPQGFEQMRALYGPSYYWRYAYILITKWYSLIYKLRINR